MSLSMSDNAIMTAFYPGMDWMSLLSVEIFITTFITHYGSAWTAV